MIPKMHIIPARPRREVVAAFSQVEKATTMDSYGFSMGFHLQIGSKPVMVRVLQAEEVEGTTHRLTPGLWDAPMGSHGYLVGGFNMFQPL